MKRLLISLIFVTSLSWSAWHFWLPTTATTPTHTTHIDAPTSHQTTVTDHGKWRILSRRIVWDKAAKSFAQRFEDENIEATLLKHKEPIMLHVFDDPRHFTQYAAAQQAQQAWPIQEVDILKRDDGTFMLGLGRFFILAYAQQHQALLENTGQAYTYTKTTKVIPTYRFVLPALAEAEAEALWRRIQAMGAIDPIMIPEHEFQMMFPNHAQ